MVCTAEQKRGCRLCTRNFVYVTTALVVVVLLLNGGGVVRILLAQPLLWFCYTEAVSPNSSVANSQTRVEYCRSSRHSTESALNHKGQWVCVQPPIPHTA
jgi:hypothetical protein